MESFSLFLLIIIGVCYFIIFSQALLYVYDKICYNVIDFVIRNGGEKTQKLLAKVLGA